MKTKAELYRYFIHLLTWCAIVFYLASAVSAAPAVSEGQSLLDELIDAARKEGQLDLMIMSPVGERRARELGAAFQRRFGVEIRFNADLSGNESQKFNQAIAETRSGIPPTFDLMQSGSDHILRLKAAGGADFIDNWELLLAQISADAYKVKDRISPKILAGYSFLWSSRIYGLAFNPRLISEQELPRTHKEMANPKYRGAFAVPPFTGPLLPGILKYDKQEWLEIVRAMGQSKSHVLGLNAGLQRLALGEFKFMLMTTQVYNEMKAADPTVPVRMRFFEDFTQHSEVMYVVQKRARHPNAAKLFALWAATPEANRMFEEYVGAENFALQTGPITQQTVRLLRAQNIRPVSWFDDSMTLEKYQWLSTEEGQKYNRALAIAQREGR